VRGFRAFVVKMSGFVMFRPEKTAAKVSIGVTADGQACGRNTAGCVVNRVITRKEGEKPICGWLGSLLLSSPRAPGISHVLANCKHRFSETENGGNFSGQMHRS